MQFWRPVPQALITELLIIRYDTTRPAPDAVGFMVALDMKMSGSPWSARKLAQWAGWSRWKATQMKDRVDSFHAEWDHDDRPSVTESKRPPKASDYANLRDGISHRPAYEQTESSHHAGASYKNITPQEHEPLKEDVDISRVKSERLDLDAAWTALEDIRLQARPNSNRSQLGKRREVFRARVTEHGVEAVVHAWSWWWTSNDPRAQFLREGGYSYSTFMRASKMRDYVERAGQWDPSEEVSGGWFDDDDFDECGNLIELKQEHTHTGE